MGLPPAAREEAFRKLTRLGKPSLLLNNHAFHHLLDAPEGELGKVVFERHSAAKKWEPGEADLTAFAGRNSAQSNALIEPLLDLMLGAAGGAIGTQPDRADAKAEIENLIYGVPGVASRPGLIAGVDNSATRTRTIAKASCASMLGSAAMLVQ